VVFIRNWNIIRSLHVCALSKWIPRFLW
jgi:hypothetical protein